MATDNCGKCGKPLIDTCPECGLPVETYSRVVGYLRPVSTWNDGKQKEYADRVEYTHWGPDHEWYHKYKANYTGTNE